MKTFKLSEAQRKLAGLGLYRLADSRGDTQDVVEAVLELADARFACIKDDSGEMDFVPAPLVGSADRPGERKSDDLDMTLVRNWLAARFMAGMLSNPALWPPPVEPGIGGADAYACRAVDYADAFLARLAREREQRAAEGQGNADGAQLQGRGRDTASQQTLPPNVKLCDPYAMSETTPQGSQRRMVRRLLEADIRWSLDRPCVVKIVTPGLSCPFCETRGFRRHGAHFDHEWRCGNGCDTSWEPDKTYLLVECETPNDQADRSAPGGEIERKGSDGNSK